MVREFVKNNFFKSLGFNSFLYSVSQTLLSLKHDAIYETFTLL